MDTLVLTCMDPRLNEYLDNEYLSEDGMRKYGKVEIWRNASGRLPPVEELRGSGARTIILAPHTDCQAKKYMYEMLKQEIAHDEIVEQAEELVHDHGFSSREEFDNLVNEEEKVFLRDRLSVSGMTVELHVVDISKIKIAQHHGEKMLVISSGTDMQSSKIAFKAGIELPCCYIIQGPYLKDLNPDINLALGLGIKKVNIVTEEGRPFR